MNLKGFYVDPGSGEYGRLPEVSSKHSLVEHPAYGCSEHLIVLWARIGKLEFI